ncbi:MAG: hypothetical protein GX455_17385 [Phycisphaerae bacterium]|nr:hypothetical protein [Phycisphaerae bacterium]
MNARPAIATLGILEILILIGVLLAIVALLRNPNGRKILLTILTVLLVVGGILFAGFFTLRVTHVPGPASMHGPKAFSDMPLMMVKPVLLLCVIMGIIGAIRGFKNKKFGTGTILIIAVLLAPALLFLVIMPISHVRVENTQPWNTPAEPSVAPSTTVESGSPIAMTDSTIPLPPGYSTPSIWQDAIAGQFTANVYPSKAGALKALRPKIDETLRTLAEGKPDPKVVLFAAGLTATEVHSLMDSKDTDSIAWSAEPLVRNLQENEISISTNFAATDSRVDTIGNQVTLKKVKGLLEVSVYPNNGKPTVLKAMIDEKPWLEDLAGFQSANPNSRFAVSRSYSSATDEKTAELEAVADACRQVARVLWEMNPKRGNLISGELTVNLTDIENRGMILDRFSQQLYGMAGPICRQALLIDLSPNKIQPLANAKFAIIAEQQETWARILLSFVGMAVVILLVYAFLNAATRGYYAWSLRIAALVLLGVGIAIVLSLA